MANYEKELTLNKAILSEALKKEEIEKVVLTYSGYGDSGNGVDIEEVEFFSGSSKTNVGWSALAKVQRGIKTYPLYAGWGAKEKPVLTERASLGDALVNLAEDLVSTHHAGYENNEGGGGTFTVAWDDTEEKYVFLLDHYDNVIIEEFTNHVF